MAQFTAHAHDRNDNCVFEFRFNANPAWDSAAIDYAAYAAMEEDERFANGMAHHVGYYATIDRG